MALTDLILRTKINTALTHLSAPDVSVQADNGVITLTGDVGDSDRRSAIETAARGVEGVTGVHNQLTYGQAKIAATPDEIVQRFLSKLDDEWNQLPNQDALTQADYVRWALWTTHKFHIPAHLGTQDFRQEETRAVEQALARISSHVNISPVLLALEMLHQVELMSLLPSPAAPEMQTPTLTSSPEANTLDANAGRDANDAAFGTHARRAV